MQVCLAFYIEEHSLAPVSRKMTIGNIFQVL
jgi:hypothetical protein